MKHIIIRDIPVSVRFDSPVYEEGYRVYGTFDREALQIVIENDAVIQAQRSALLHELGHAHWRLSWGGDVELIEEEEYCRGLEDVRAILHDPRNRWAREFIFP